MYTGQPDAQKIETASAADAPPGGSVDEKSTKQLQDRLSMYSGQLDAQKIETASAVDVLRDANREMEKIRFEKKQLLAQWKSSLLAVQRRDEHLQSLQVLIHRNPPMSLRYFLP
ncbi:hypothetical protein T484DRAFT_1853778 [Baffinella frigidus]|nr:hypothetical protein T484DRAFT_1853778 [Cryptophyta sp. CCMP2293]